MFAPKCYSLELREHGEGKAWVERHCLNRIIIVVGTPAS